MTESTGQTHEFDDTFDVLSRLLDEAGVTPDDAARIVPRADRASAPMSFAQELLWLLDRATPGLTAYNMPLARRVRGPLDRAALQRALDAVAARHEALRTRLTDAGGEPRQLVAPPGPVALTVVDLAATPADRREAEAARIVQERARTPFDLAAEPCFRATLVALAADDHVLVLESHHIAVDGWSLGIIQRELGEAYAAIRKGGGYAAPVPEVQYGDFAAWQRSRLTGAHLEELLAFWRTQLGDATEPLDLPTDRPRGRVATFEGAREVLRLDAAALGRIKAAAQREDVTLYMVLLAAFGAVLHRWSERANVLIGSGSAGRTQHETEPMVGYLNNTLVQRADFTGDPTVRELLARVKASALGAYDHQEIPLEKLVLELRQGADRLENAPLFDVVLTMQNVLAGGLALDGCTVEPFGAELGATKFDLTLLPSERPEGLLLNLHYRSELFRADTVRRMLAHLGRVLDAIATAPEQRVSAIALGSDEERSIVAAANDTRVDEGAPATLHALFEAQAARVGSRLAVVGPRASATAAGSVAGTTAYTYVEVNARANQLARHLATLGAGRGTRVGVLLDRTGDAIIAMLGILKAGAAWVPMAVDAPKGRLVQQASDAGLVALVTASAHLALAPEGVTAIALDRDAAQLGALADGNLAATATPDDPAYVLYTSGSTGTPKGAIVTHRNIVHYARAVSRVLAGTPAGTSGDGFAAVDGWRFGLVSSLAADLGNTSLVPSLLAGGTLHVLAREVATEPARFAEYVSVHALDVLKVTPNHLAALTAGRTGADLAAVLPRQWLVLGGEALRPAFARSLIAAGSCRVLNHYGPTETTVGVCTFEVTSASLAAVEALGAQTVPIGRPLANTRARVVDAHGHEQPLGVPGELWISGDGVSNGYLKRADLTAERFVDDAGARTYRTGDRVRRLADGTIEFLGRTDDQVKVRGYRVELAEVELALAAHPGVAQAAVVIRVDDAGEPQLVAYAVARQAGYAVSHADRPTREKLAEWLAAQLPAHMLPQAVVLLGALPLTANGKVDKARLPAPDATESAAPAFVAPTTDTEVALAAIWADVLKRERIGVTDNFIELGGHSLMAIRMLGKISKTFGVRLPLRAVFEAPTVAALAELLDVERQLAQLEALEKKTGASAPPPTPGA
ncbi:MAG: amino acid adenylation domain-containing protein [Gemmatimonadetes bacterium]|nr:amino acid adenylation domain-containing protein [Gemmatimonadota bacterium]